MEHKGRRNNKLLQGLEAATGIKHKGKSNGHNRIPRKKMPDEIKQS